MNKGEYSIACTEVLEVLNYISEEDYNKIPKDVIDILEKNKRNDILFLYNPWKSLNEQKMSEKGRIMIASLFKDYLATSKQREKITRYQKNKNIEIQEEKRKKYNYDNSFIKKQKIERAPQTSLINYENKSWYKKVFDFISGLFKKNIKNNR